MSSLVESITTIVIAIIGLAIVAVLVSKNANTTGVIQAGASGLANNLAVAAAPVSGINFTPSLGYPSANSLGMGFGS